mmetsp:Transcript_10166/g.25344  ORF Transcript_10166/g.25344 Transcript_10166/m.25344 type:complete len:201 (+) Transcript_10166:296-898(+)
MSRDLCHGGAGCARVRTPHGQQSRADRSWQWACRRDSESDARGGRPHSRVPPLPGAGLPAGGTPSQTSRRSVRKGRRLLPLLVKFSPGQAEKKADGCGAGGAARKTHARRVAKDERTPSGRAGFAARRSGRSGPRSIGRPRARGKPDSEVGAPCFDRPDSEFGVPCSDSVSPGARGDAGAPLAAKWQSARALAGGGGAGI